MPTTTTTRPPDARLAPTPAPGGTEIGTPLAEPDSPALATEARNLVVNSDYRPVGVWYDGRLYTSALAVSAAKAWQESHDRELGEWPLHYPGLWGDE
jgi:hypothetical protein